jgi:hypothetical protein
LRVGKSVGFHPTALNNCAEESALSNQEIPELCSVQSNFVFALQENSFSDNIAAVVRLKPTLFVGFSRLIAAERHYEQHPIGPKNKRSFQADVVRALLCSYRAIRKAHGQTR